jgi:hypothetical protein
MQATPLLARVPREHLGPAMQAARALAQRGDATFVAVAANAPQLFHWYGRFYAEVFYGGRVAGRIKELLRLRLSTPYGCALRNKGKRLAAAEAGLSGCRCCSRQEYSMRSSTGVCAAISTTASCSSSA